MAIVQILKCLFVDDYRYDLRSQRLDFSLTDTQLPMFMRIFNLVLALQNGDLDRQAGANSAGTGNELNQGKHSEKIS